MGVALLSLPGTPHQIYSNHCQIESIKYMDYGGRTYGRDLHHSNGDELLLLVDVLHGLFYNDDSNLPYPVMVALNDHDDEREGRSLLSRSWCVLHTPHEDFSKSSECPPCVVAESSLDGALSANVAVVDDGIFWGRVKVELGPQAAVLVVEDGSHIHYMPA
ncbi:hypothetical protein LIER_00517 [Lithospermum erythrorhizon]|uniref:Uncharacterized protein n=1 Tax=Lithospermum erythrorhizon TaxID=34254 RepID=A0AAV3NHM4_LITER